VRLLLPEVRDLTFDELPDLYDQPGPHLRADFVLSVDGAIAVDGRAGPLGSPADKAVFTALRTVSDAVIVGAGTARTENYGPVRHQEAAAAWRAAHDRSPETPLVVVTRSGGIPVGARFLTGPLIVAAPEGVAVPEFRGEVIPTVDPAELVGALHERGFTRLLCEGGPMLLTSLLQAGVVDELCLTTDPTLVGGGPHLVGALPDPRSLTLVSLVHDDPGVLLARWAVAATEAT
jgi:5-amino-6-(5-phosphoribosylamino)uracil reductase